jgi:hypothetical protein
MRAVLAGVALAAFVITPSLADYYIIQEPTTKRCRIVRGDASEPPSCVKSKRPTGWRHNR